MKGGKGRMAVVKALAIFSLPLILLETATGVISLLTGSLSIPPLVGLGTAVDLAILLAGIGVAVVWRHHAAQQAKSLADSPPDDEKMPPS